MRWIAVGWLVGCGASPPPVTGCVEPGTWWTDADGDGFAGTQATGCVAPEGAAFVATDCDDADARVNPAMCDTPDDGLDNDCDGIHSLAGYEGVYAYSGDLVVTSPTDLVGFCDARNAIDGSLVIADLEDVDLTDLWCLCMVRGDVVIERTSALGSLAGLEALALVEGTIRLAENAGLVDVSALTGVAVEGSVELEADPRLETPFDAASIGGDLVARDLPALTDLPGLGVFAGSLLVERTGLVHLGPIAPPNLEALTGDVVIRGNDALVDVIDPFPELEEIGGSVIFANNPALESARMSVDVIGGDLVLTGAPSMTRLPDFPALATLGGSLILEDVPHLARIDLAASSIGGDVSVVALPALARIDLDAVTIGGSLTIQANPVLTSAALPALERVVGDLRVAENPALVELGDPLGPLVTVGGAVTLEANQQLGYDGAGANVGLLARLQSVGQGLAVTDDALFPYALPPGELAWVGLNVAIVRSGDPSAVLSFPQLGAVYGSVVADGPAPVLDLPALSVVAFAVAIVNGAGGILAPNLERAPGGILVANHPSALTLDLSGVTSADVVQFEGTPPGFRSLSLGALEMVNHLTLIDVPGLTSIDLPALASVDGGVVVSGCDGLVDLRGLGALATVGGDFVLDQNASLVSAEGSALAEVGGLVLTGNPALTSLSALESLQSVDGGMVVTDNGSLPTGAVDALVAAIGLENIGGPIEVSGNGTLIRGR